jgi:hypothetical protein
MKPRRILLTLLAASLAGSGMAGCGSQPADPPADPNHLKEIAETYRTIRAYDKRVSLELDDCNTKATATAAQATSKQRCIQRSAERYVRDRRGSASELSKIARQVSQPCAASITALTDEYTQVTIDLVNANRLTRMFIKDPTSIDDRNLSRLEDLRQKGKVAEGAILKLSKAVLPACD